MERVQFHQEQSLPELKDFLQKGIFTKDEVKHILKKRTAFESALVRRVAKKGDFLRYAAYEMGLETLRRKRVARQESPSPPSISDYALVRRQFYIFERAVRKFKSDLSLWVQYIQLAKRQRARALAGRLCARALQLHPTSPALFILASSYELDELSHSGARATLQRGLRFNPESVEMWTEYVKMELGFIESLRRRWDVLGIKNGGEAPGENVDDKDAQKEIMEGAIVKTVIQSALKAINSEAVPLIHSLRKLIHSYPIPPPLRSQLLDHLHSSLITSFADNVDVLFIYGTWFLDEATEEKEDLVEMLKTAEGTMRKFVLEGVGAVGKGKEKETTWDGKSMASLYARWVTECYERLEEPNLRLYVSHSLQTLIALIPPESASSSLLAASLNISQSTPKLRKQARKYTTQFPESAQLWLAMLKIEDQESVRDVWKEARRCVKDGGKEDGIWKVWIWGLDGLGLERDEQVTLLETLLSESLTNSIALPIYPRLLRRYIITLHPSVSPPTAAERVQNIKRITQKHLVSTSLQSVLFEHEASLAEPSREVLQCIYSSWRTIKGEEIEAGLKWAEWLLKTGDGKEAFNVVKNLGGKPEVESRWGKILENYENEQDDERSGAEEAREDDEDMDDGGLGVMS